MLQVNTRWNWDLFEKKIEKIADFVNGGFAKINYNLFGAVQKCAYLLDFANVVQRIFTVDQDRLVVTSDGEGVRLALLSSSWNANAGAYPASKRFSAARPLNARDLF